ncbi:hypothetical protein EDB85DRAFT_1508216 [Lactarius pseudohatsudake]|nr:hypothetical protein EDB85DRAFT_1508216 [Lactarius pseudohatsudake]
MPWTPSMFQHSKVALRLQVLQVFGVRANGAGMSEHPGRIDGQEEVLHPFPCCPCPSLTSYFAPTGPTLCHSLLSAATGTPNTAQHLDCRDIPA